MLTISSGRRALAILAIGSVLAAAGAASATTASAATATTATTATAATASAAAGAAQPPVPATKRAGAERLDRLAATQSRSVIAVTFAPGRAVAAADVAAGARREGGSMRRTLTRFRTVTVSVPRERAAAFTTAQRARPGVQKVEVLTPRSFSFVPNDPEWVQQQAALGAVRASAAWDVQRADPAVKIAVVDSGVDLGHPDLDGRVVGTYNAVDAGTDVTDAVGHGTFVAGVAAATGNNSIGIAGAALGASVLAVKVADNATGAIYPDTLAAGIDWATSHGANIINMSLGGPDSSEVERLAVAHAVAAGVLVVAAAGNEGSSVQQFPAAYPGVVSVGATTGSGARASFSSFGPWVTVAAPGTTIRGTAPVVGSQYFAPSYDTADGTSFSSPLVAAEAAIVWSKRPDWTAAQVKSAVVGSAHGYTGLGLGTGQVDFAAALTRVPPATAPTITAPAAAATLAGTVRLVAASTAPAVRFLVGGVAQGGAVPVSGGAAHLDVTTFGLPNGATTVTAYDCTLAWYCNNASSTVRAVLANAAPVLTAPAAGRRVSGTLTLTATAPGGGVAFLIDGLRRSVDGQAPYTLTYPASLLADGTHTARVVSCTSSGSLCHGPASGLTSFTNASLHPKITALAPAVFSPNGDRVADTTSVTYALPDYESVSWVVRNSAGAVVRGPIVVGYQTAGTRTFRWDGRTNSGAWAGGGTYSIELLTQKPLSTGWWYGYASTSVLADVTRPAVSAVTGDTVRFFPYPDTYLDTFRTGYSLSEPATMTMTVRSSTGAVVRSFAVSRVAGSSAIDWNGRTNTGALAGAGTYTWTLTAADRAGNTVVTPARRAVVDARKLLWRGSVTTLRGSNAYASGGTLACAGTLRDQSAYKPYGMWLRNGCASAPTSELATASYAVTVPGAARYGTVKVESLGYSHVPQSTLGVGLYQRTTDTFTVPTPLTLTTRAAAWRTVGWVAASGLVDANRRVDLTLFVPNDFAQVSDYDISHVRVSVSYQVLG